MEVTNINELYRNVLELLNGFNAAKEIHLMQTLSDTYLSETQFAQVVGRMRTVSYTHLFFAIYIILNKEMRYIFHRLLFGIMVSHREDVYFNCILMN